MGWATWDVGYRGTATLARRRHGGVANAVRSTLLYSTLFMAHISSGRAINHTFHSTFGHRDISPRGESRRLSSRRQFNTFVIAGADSRSCFHT